VKVVVTGAAGFLGRILVGRILRKWSDAADRFTFIDREPIPDPADRRVSPLVGVLPDLEGLDAALETADVVFHLAALPGGAAEMDYRASRVANLEVPIALLETLASRTKPARVIYASSVAVFGDPLPEMIDDTTASFPTMTYGAHKLMVETSLVNLTRLGRIGGIALRLCGLLARPPGAVGLRSAFLSELFHACVARRPIALPTSPDATVWVMSATRAAENLIHAAGLPISPASNLRAMTLPALRVTVYELAAAVAVATGCDTNLVRFERDEALERQFGRLPVLCTGAADALGFSTDGTLAALVSRALRDAGYPDSVGSTR
jgi:nucleoside-diphosphate-sugar epimerase